MSQYHTFTAHDAVAYAQQFAGIDNPSELVSAQEVGDGNLNLVFKVFDRQGVSRAIVKQALPYVRCVGESWPLTLDRARLEAQTLIAHYQHSPQHTVKIHHFDPELAVCACFPHPNPLPQGEGAPPKKVLFSGIARRRCACAGLQIAA